LAGFQLSLIGRFWVSPEAQLRISTSEYTDFREFDLNLQPLLFEQKHPSWGLCAAAPAVSPWPARLTSPIKSFSG